MSETVTEDRHLITHRVHGRDSRGELPDQWFASIDHGQNFVGVTEKPEPGDHLSFERRGTTVRRPMMIAYPRGFALLKIETGEVEALDPSE